jgi:moderate conductance mechanosensitive channel
MPVLAAPLSSLIAHPLVTRLAAGATDTPAPTPKSPSITDQARQAANKVLQPETAITCTKDQLSVCGVVFRWTGHRGLGQALEVILGVPLRLVLIVGLAVFLRRVLHKVINRLVDRIAEGPTSQHVGGATGSRAVDPPPVSSMLTTRRQARARTLGSVLSSATTALIIVVAALMVLSELGLPIGPLVASASVIGVALGLGAQSLVRDVVTGMFMIAEDQYGVGDVVDVGSATGSVEAVGLRVTRLRDVNGTVWYVRNGEILRVGNQSQGWARTVLDVNVGLGEDLDRVEEALLETAEELRRDEQFGRYILDEPEVWGVESLTVDGVLMRVVVKTLPLQQWTVARELRRRIKYQFDEEGIEMKSSPHPVITDEKTAPAEKATQDETP